MVENSYSSLGIVYEDAPPSSQSEDRSLELLVHLKSDILNTKLDILTAALQVRLGVFAHNLDRIDADRGTLETMLVRLDTAARYHLREHSEKGPLYRQLFALETEARTQATECWRDLFLVIRDFLLVWEAHQQAQARAIFIENVGATTAGYLPQA